MTASPMPKAAVVAWMMTNFDLYARSSFISDLIRLVLVWPVGPPPDN